MNLSQFKSEDYISTFIGLLMLLLTLIFPSLIPIISPSFNSFDGLFQVLYMLLFIGILSGIGLKILGDKMRGFIPSFISIFAIAMLSQYICGTAFIQNIGFESVFFSVAIGLLIRNFIGLPAWLSVGVKSEYYIKAGLVLLGTSILFGEIIREGALGMIQAVVVVLSVWYFAFWLAKKLKVDREMSIMLASAVSICGVSAAIATCGAIKGDNKKLSLVISLVLVVAIPMMYFMPYLAQLMGLSQEVAGAWIGGTIDTTGGVVASGKFIGETAEQYSVIIKSAQNVLLGFAALAISIYWSYKGVNKNHKPSPAILWERFPKFVIGFLLASLIFSFMLSVPEAKELGKITKGLRETLFSIAFVCIGLETDFRTIFKKENLRYITTFLVAQFVNIVVTLLMAILLFSLLKNIF